MARNYLSISKFERCRGAIAFWEWICNFISLYWACDYLSMLGLELIQVRKMAAVFQYMFWVLLNLHQDSHPIANVSVKQALDNTGSTNLLETEFITLREQITCLCVRYTPYHPARRPVYNLSEFKWQGIPLLHLGYIKVILIYTYIIYIE